MRDYWLTQEILRGIGLAYIALAVVALGLALWLPKRWWMKLMAVAVVLGMFSILPRQAQKEVEQQQVVVDEFKQRQAKAKALFDERCKTAGEKIYRTVENVDGVLLVKGRLPVNRQSQFDPNDPAGDDAHGMGYVESFLLGYVSEVQQTAQNTKGAFKFVDLVDPTDQQRYRYTGVPTPRPHSPDVFDLLIAKEKTMAPAPRYGVTWDDISTPEDRELWVAGGVIKVIDLQTQEVLASRTGYILDTAQGNTSGGRDPWTFATYNACPALPKLHEQYPYKRALTRNFVTRIVKPTQGEK